MEIKLIFFFLIFFLLHGPIFVCPLACSIFFSYTILLLAAGMSGQRAPPFLLRSLVVKGASSQGSCTFGPTFQHLHAWYLLHQGQRAGGRIWCCRIASVLVVCTFMGVMLCFVWEKKKSCLSPLFFLFAKCHRSCISNHKKPQNNCYKYINC